MWVPVSFTSWCITSSIVLLGNNSFAWEVGPDNGMVWVLVCKSA